MTTLMEPTTPMTTTTTTTTTAAAQANPTTSQPTSLRTNTTNNNNNNTNSNKQKIPIVCPGHTRPLTELQFVPLTPPRTVGESSSTAVSSSSSAATTKPPPPDILLLSACHDKQPMVRNGRTGDWMGTLTTHKGAVWSCRMDTATQSYIATTSGDFTCHVHDASTGQNLYQFTDAQHIVKTCDFNPVSATVLATAGQEGMVRLYNLIEQEQLFFLAAGSSSSTKTKTKSKKSKTNVIPKEIHVRPVPSSSTTSSSTTSTNKKISIGKLIWYNDTILMIGGSDGTIRFYDTSILLDGGTVDGIVDGTSGNENDNDYPALHIIHTHAHSNDNNNDTNNKIIDANHEIRDMEMKQIIPSSSSSSSSIQKNEHEHDDDAQQPYLALTVAAGKTVYIYDITNVATAAAVSSSSTLSTWNDTGTGTTDTTGGVRLLLEFPVPHIHFYNEGGVSLHPLGNKFIVGGSDLYVYLYGITYPNDATTTTAPIVTQLECYKGHHGPIRCLRYSPLVDVTNNTNDDGGDTYTFASGSEDGTIRLWQTY